MDRGAWQAAVHGVAMSDKTESTQHTRTWESCIPFFGISMTFPIKAHLNSDYILASWIVVTRLERADFSIIKTQFKSFLQESSQFSPLDSHYIHQNNL